jgi:hypothetical protein
MSPALPGLAATRPASIFSPGRWWLRFARLYDVAVIVVAHPTKEVGRDGKARPPTLYDIEGSALGGTPYPSSSSSGRPRHSSPTTCAGTAEAAFNVWYGGRVEQSGRNSYPPRPHAQKCAVRSRLPPLQGKAGLTSAHMNEERTTRIVGMALGFIFLAVLILNAMS